MKRTFLKMVVAAGAAMLVSGCATGIKHEQMASSLPSLKAGQGRIYVYRPSSMVGAVLTPDVRLNNEMIGQSKTGGFFFVDRPAGNYVASTSTETEKTVSFALAPGETKYIRAYVTFGVAVGRVNLQLETPEKAQAEMNSLSYTGTPLASN